MDDTYQDYVNRVAPMTLSLTHRQQVQHIQKSAKFDQGKALPFPGYTLTAPPWEDDSSNQIVYQKLEITQKHLAEKLGNNFFMPIPPRSFHVTFADLIWENNFRNQSTKNPQFEEQICERLHHSFKQYQQEYPVAQPIHFQPLGLTLFTRGIVICLAPAQEKSYEQIRYLRRMIYQNLKLIELGIEQQYHFTAHISLGYFQENPQDIEREKIVEVLASLNDQLVEKPLPELIIKEAQLRQFDDMLRYYRHEHFPILTL